MVSVSRFVQPRGGPSASEGVDVVVYGWVGEQLRAILPGALNASVERHGNQVHELRRDLRLFSVAEEPGLAELKGSG